MVTADEIRSIALSFPETEEHDHWDKPSFHVRSKIFAVIQPDGVSLVIKTTKEDRVAYTTMDPDVYQMPESFQNLAFMIVRMDRIQRDECRNMLMLAWSLVAPKKVFKAFNETLGFK
ncbi:hypothetical protein QFZ77_002675 [Paenibacillus sp. V4I3]|uniref:MmcQ/YjbR family DNA-binding protein n=1 Tax=Paenibacillus sp. V4I3 TaxID=3042305 RepID=UPI002788DD64|nr:MmcQ/YjbR family DNA-binding protein [Paenibacillus sp. V4I3]MDQ0874016.1 hypothetical protein [Paenibacillus sp. V4I3]